MNKLTTAVSAIALSTLVTGCQNGLNSEGKIIEKPDVQVVNGEMTPEILEAFGRINEAVASPDGSKIAFTLAYDDIATDKSNAEIYLVNTDGTGMRRLTRSAGSEANIRWIDGGKRIAFISDCAETKNRQLYTMTPEGRNIKKVSNVENGVQCFEFAPDGKHVVYGSNIKPYLSLIHI